VIDLGSMRGFNYTPSYATTGMWWSDFRHETVEAELRLGKEAFPSFNTVRVFLGYNSYLGNRGAFSAAFEDFLGICADLSIVVAPVLFNRWHSGLPDFGGIYLDHFVPGQSYVQFELNSTKTDYRASIGFDKQFVPYLNDIVGAHRDDPRIAFWDLCNEPFFGPLASESQTTATAEMAWLELIAAEVRGFAPAAPVTVGTHALHGVEGVFRVEHLSDFISTHPYVDNVWMPARQEFTAFLDELIARAATVGKELLASETVWGSVDDLKRADTLAFTLEELTKRKIGFLAFGLNHSLASDLHKPEFGSITSAGSCAFLDEKGRIREGHGVFNDY
jgi:hypothetical protein